MATPNPQDDPSADDGPVERHAPFNPFAPGGGEDAAPPPPGKISIDPSIEFEPHLQTDRMPLPPSAHGVTEEGYLLDAQQSRPDPNRSADADAVEHTVWDEPALAGDLAGTVPEDQMTYGRWLAGRIAATDGATSWGMTLLIILSAGPWGILGALMSQSGATGIGFGGLLAAVILAPITEEITKVATALWAVEKRPYWFKSAWQIMLTAAAGGLAFAAIENLIYLNVYAPGKGSSFAAWRWIVCTGLHLTCSSIAGVGLVRIWRGSVRDLRRPELADGMPFFAAAMVLHGLYNAAATLGQITGLLTFQ